MGLFNKKPALFTPEWASILSDEQLKNEHDATFYDIKGYPPGKSKIPGTQTYTLENAEMARRVLTNEMNRRSDERNARRPQTGKYRHREHGTYLPNDE